MQKSNWYCAAIDHGVTVFPNGKIGPCCRISADYLKPSSELSNTQRFADLSTPEPPVACHSCVDDEFRGMTSYRKMFNKLATAQPGLQFVDIRNTNLCNLKCRYCGPHFSSQWAHELQHSVPIVSTSVDKKLLITDSLHWMYFTGGEPLINGEHWDLLQELIETDRAQGITLVYNSNLTSLKYKNRDIVDIWAHFKKVNIKCSIDAVGRTFEYIRSGAEWHTVNTNIDLLKQLPVDIELSPVISLLNIWNIGDLCEYARLKKLKITPIILSGPDYLALDVIPDQLKSQALIAALPLKQHVDINTYNHVVQLIENNQNQCLFKHAITHILLLDNLRSEKLFDLLPFRHLAKTHILENHEYESK